MEFGEALRALKSGRRMRRRGWRGRGMFVALMPGVKLAPASSAPEAHTHRVDEHTATIVGREKWLDVLPYYAMWTAAGQLQPGWLAAQADMQADDWEPAT